MVGSLEAAAALLLACAGMAKIVVPAPATALLRRVWSRASTPEPVVRVAGVLEVVIASYTVLSGTRAALHGMMYGLVVFAFSCIFGGDERIVVLGCISGAVVANYFCIKALFGSVYRVEYPVATQPQQEGQPEAEQPPAHS